MDWIAEYRRRRELLPESGGDAMVRSPERADTLERLERERGVELPSDYRRFVLEVGTGGECWDGRLLRLDAAFARSKGSLAAPFQEATSRDIVHGPYPRSDAPGLLWISESGGSYGSALALTASERGHVWTFVECWPGWIPATDGIEDRLRGAPLAGEGDLFDFYAVALSDENRAVRHTFRSWIESWVEDRVRRASRAERPVGR